MLVKTNILNLSMKNDKFHKYQLKQFKNYHFHKKKKKEVKSNHYFVPYALVPASPRPGRINAFSFNSLSTNVQKILT